LADSCEHGNEPTGSDTQRKSKHNPCPFLQFIKGNEITRAPLMNDNEAHTDVIPTVIMNKPGQSGRAVFTKSLRSVKH
jgi:hypothetical protein